MGTKNKPGEFDCYSNAEADEPMFVILGRDKTAAFMVNTWINIRMVLGLNKPNDQQIIEASECAAAMHEYYRRTKEKPVVKLFNWSLVQVGDQWWVPGDFGFRLVGVLEDHPEIEDGGIHVTGPINMVNGTQAISENLVYELQNINQRYKEYMQNAWMHGELDQVSEWEPDEPFLFLELEFADK